MAIVGFIVFLIGLGCLWGYRSQKQTLGEILLTQTSQVGELKERAMAVQAELGAGYFNEYAELKGEIQCSSPLTTPFSQKSCVHYTADIRRKWEVERWVTASDGTEVAEIEEKSETLYRETHGIPFYLSDTSGEISIQPDLGLNDKVSQTQTFRPEELDLSPEGIHYQGHLLPWNNRVDFETNQEILEYTLTESYFPAQGPVYALGVVKDTPEGLVLSKPDEKGQKYLVTSKTEEELIENKSSGFLFWLGVVFCVLGAGLGVAGLF